MTLTSHRAQRDSASYALPSHPLEPLTPEEISLAGSGTST